MKILAVNGHPDASSYVSALFREYIKHLDLQQHELKAIELGKMNFDPVLRFGYRKRMESDPDIEESQNLVKWADHIVLFYPIWFETVPSLLKGWFERVLTPGFAYNMDGFKVAKLLKGKTAHLISTSHAPTFYQRLTGDIELKTVKRTLNFCGIKIKQVDRLGCYVAGKYESHKKRMCFLTLIAKRARKVI